MALRAGRSRPPRRLGLLSAGPGYQAGRHGLSTHDGRLKARVTSRLGSDPCPTGRRASTNPDRTLRLSWARKPDARPADADLVEGAASHHVGSSCSSHSRQIHTSPRLSRALSAAGTMVTPQAGQMGGCSSSSTPQSISARGWDDPGGGTHPHRRGDREGTRSAGYACLSRPSRPGPARGAPAVLPG